MSVKPILFSGPMIRALLEGRKTQTRRIIKPQPGADVTSAGVISRSDVGKTDEWSWLSGVPGDVDTWGFEGDFKTRYQPGDLLWVRETWGINNYEYFGEPIPKARPDDLASEQMVYFATEDDCEILSDMPKRPSIYMPRWFSRLTLEVTNVRVQRLWEITEEDAEGEGAWHWAEAYDDARVMDTPREAFAHLWDSINEMRGFGWGANPWVAAITFAVNEINVDALIARRIENDARSYA